MSLGAFDDRLRFVLGAAHRLAASSGVLTVAHLMLAALDPYPGAPPSTGSFGVNVELAASQALSTVDLWARERGETPTVEHLLVVLVDQADPATAAVLTSRGRDPATLRRDALARLGAPTDTPQIALAPLAVWPAGTAGRPPLPLKDLPAALWSELVARHNRLQVGQLRRRWYWDAICLNEQRAVMRIADRHHLGDDERYSLAHYHWEEVTLRGHNAAPTLVPERPSNPRSAGGAGDSRPVGTMITTRRRRFGFWQTRAGLRGWACWLGNRRVGLAAALVRITSG